MNATPTTDEVLATIPAIHAKMITEVEESVVAHPAQLPALKSLRWRADGDRRIAIDHNGSPWGWQEASTLFDMLDTGIDNEGLPRGLIIDASSTTIILMW